VLAILLESPTAILQQMHDLVDRRQNRRNLASIATANRSLQDAECAGRAALIRL